MNCAIILKQPNTVTKLEATHLFIYHINVYKSVLNVLLYVFNVDSFPTISLQPSGLSQNTVGQRRELICSIYLSPVVDINTIRLGWLYEDDITTDNSRVTVDRLSKNFNNNTLVKSIHFDTLAEEDENEYFCYVIINTLFLVKSLALEHFKSKLFLVRIYTDK